MRKRVGFVQKAVNAWPGRKIFGIYRFMPIFFVFGAVLEFSMINWRPFGVNFYDVYEKKEAQKIAEQSLLHQDQEQ